jgi:hypothetical protein
MLNAGKRNIPWQSLRNRFLEGEPGVYEILLGALDSDPIFRVFNHLPRALSPDQFAVLLLLGLFWQQGPYAERFARAMDSFGVCTSRDDINTVLRFASERGYICFAVHEKLKRIGFVHPIFTIYCRIVLHELLRRAQAAVANPQSDGRVSTGCSVLATDMSRRPDSSLSKAVQLYATIGTQVLCETFYNRDFLVWFLNDVDYQRAFLQNLPKEVTVAGPASFSIQPNPAANHFLNTLTCFRLCLDSQRALSPTDWPFEHFVQMAIYVMSAGTVTEASLFADQYESLLSRILAPEPRPLDLSPLLENWTVVTTINLGLLRKFHATTNHGSRWREFVRQARLLCESREEKTPFEKGAMLGLLLLELEPDGAEFTEDLRRMFEEVVSDKTEVRTAPDERLTDNIADGLSRGTTEEQNAREQIRGFIPPILKVKPKARSMAASSFLGLLDQLQSSGQSNQQAGGVEHSMPSGVGILLKYFHRKPQTRLFTNRYLSSFLSEWGGKHFNTGELAEQIHLEQVQVNAAETALKAADWSSLATSHVALFKQHLRKGDFRQASEYLRECIVALGADPALTSVVEGLKPVQRCFVLVQTVFGITSAETDSAPPGCGES